MDRRLLGSIGEAKAKLHFIEQGYDVFSPETINPSVDFIVMKNGEIKTIQVKSSSRDEIKLQTCYKVASGNKAKNFDSDPIDYLFVFHQPSDTYKIVDAKLYKGRSSVRYQKL